MIMEKFEGKFDDNVKEKGEGEVNNEEGKNCFWCFGCEGM
jgi:hypothetical protein